MKRSMRSLAMAVLWPSFLCSALAVGCFFSVFHPDALWEWSPMAVYTVGFFCFWSLCALSGMLTYYLVTVPEDYNPPF